MIKSLLYKLIPSKLKWVYRSSAFYQTKLIREWDSFGDNHLIKEKNIIELQKKFNYKLFLETGTLHGEMVYKLYDYFEKLITIELDLNLHKAAKKRLKGYPKIEFLQGDSGKVLPSIINNIKGSCVFWLDAHFSGGDTAQAEKDTPIEEEINCVLSQKEDHIILIDDARCFGNKDYPDYPTLEAIDKLILSKKPNYQVEVIGDIIRAYPKKANQ